MSTRGIVFFLAKFCSQKNSRVLISNMTIVFFKFQLKNTQIRHFCPQIQTFLFFCEILKLAKLEGADFKCDNSFLKFQLKNTQIKYIWSQIWTFLFFRKLLQSDKFEGADFKYSNSYFFQVLAQKYLNNVFLIPNLGISIFHKLLQLDKFEGTDFKYVQVRAQKYANLAFLVPSFGPRFLFFARNFAIRQIGGH